MSFCIRRNFFHNLKQISSYCTQNHINNHTIYGLSSGFGKCGVAVIRVSGSSTFKALQSICKLNGMQLIRPRYAHLKNIYHPTTGELIDKGLVIWFPHPASFTGEDSCEFQVHGGPAVIQAMYDALASIENCRQAKHGEFTKRAFYSGKLDLTEVEGLADLIHSETENQRKQALLQASGSLTLLYQKWRKSLLKNLAHVEAFIDFSEDELIEDTVLNDVSTNVREIINEIKSHLNDNRCGERLRTGVRATIIGVPNVGKSSFLNLICQKPLAIVTNIAGTTRDIIETCYNISGYPIIFADTAGIRTKTNDIIEMEGISRTLNHIKLSDFVILILDVRDVLKSNENLSSYLTNHLKELNLNEDLKSMERIIVLNKIDLLTTDEKNHISMICDDEEVVLLSCETGDGINSVVSRITNSLQILCGFPSRENPVISQARHREHLQQCLKDLEEFCLLFLSDQKDNDYAIAAHKLRNSVRSIGQITGDVSTEEILDVIFKDFCIGK